MNPLLHQRGFGLTPLFNQREFEPSFFPPFFPFVLFFFLSFLFPFLPFFFALPLDRPSNLHRTTLAGPPKISFFVFFLPPQISFPSLSLGVFSWNCGRGSRPRSTPNARLDCSGLILCESTPVTSRRGQCCSCECSFRRGYGAASHMGAGCWWLLRGEWDAFVFLLSLWCLRGCRSKRCAKMFGVSKKELIASMAFVLRSLNANTALSLELTMGV